MKIAILGATGMLGTMMLDVFKNSTYDIVLTARSEKDFCDGFDWKILDAQTFSVEEIESVIEGCDWIINCIGIIKPYIKEKESFTVQRAMEVNGLFPHKLVKAAENQNCKVIQIATDCVYDGIKGEYVEEDLHNPTDVYGKTKSLGEVYSPNMVNLRCSIIGPEQRGKTSLLEWFLNQPKNTELNGFLNHQWNGLTTYHFARICKGIVDNDFSINGLQHVVPEGFVNKAQMLHSFADVYNRQDIKITDIEAKEAIDRTILTSNKEVNKRLWNLAGYKQIPTVQEMIKELQNVRAK